MKKGFFIISFLVTLMLLFSVSAVNGESASFPSGDFKYNILDDGTAEIVRYTGEAAELDIPGELDGITVTSIGGFVLNTDLKKVNIPDTVTNIQDAAFLACISLSELTIPDSVTSIGNDAFGVCRALTSVTIPDSVTSVGENPFSDCSGLVNITVSENHPYLKTIDGVLFSKPDNRLIAYPIALTAGEYTVPDGTRIIGHAAFNQCNTITGIIIPDGVTKIENSAFLNCSSLASVTIPDTVTDIADDAFRACSSLTVYASAHSYAAQYCRDHDISWKSETFTSGDYQYTLLEDGTAKITRYSGTAEELLIPEELDGYSVTMIGEQAFSFNTALVSITIPDSVTVLDTDAFSCLSALTDITIPDSVTSIGDKAFNYCDSLTHITIPDSVNSMGYNPFVECPKLTDIHVSPEHPYLATIDGVLFSKPDKRLICYPSAFTAESYTIPQNILEIDSLAFCDATSLVNVSIPDSVTRIGSGSFLFCDHLTDLSIPDHVVKIEKMAFKHCRALTTVTIPDSVSLIGSEAFADCTSLTAVTIPSSVLAMGSDVFSGDSLLTVTVYRDTFASQYCMDNGINYTYADALDWLNN